MTLRSGGNQRKTCSSAVCIVRSWIVPNRRVGEARAAPRSLSTPRRTSSSRPSTSGRRTEIWNEPWTVSPSRIVYTRPSVTSAEPLGRLYSSSISGRRSTSYRSRRRRRDDGVGVRRRRLRHGRSSAAPAEREQREQHCGGARERAAGGGPDGRGSGVRAAHGFANQRLGISSVHGSRSDTRLVHARSAVESASARGRGASAPTRPSPRRPRRRSMPQVAVEVAPRGAGHEPRELLVLVVVVEVGEELERRVPRVADVEVVAAVAELRVGDDDARERPALGGPRRRRLRAQQLEDGRVADDEGEQDAGGSASNAHRRRSARARRAAGSLGRSHRHVDGEGELVGRDDLRVLVLLLVRRGSAWPSAACR